MAKRKLVGLLTVITVLVSGCGSPSSPLNKSFNSGSEAAVVVDNPSATSGVQLGDIGILPSGGTISPQFQLQPLIAQIFDIPIVAYAPYEFMADNFTGSGVALSYSGLVLQTTSSSFNSIVLPAVRGLDSYTVYSCNGSLTNADLGVCSQIGKATPMTSFAIGQPNTTLIAVSFGRELSFPTSNFIVEAIFSASSNAVYGTQNATAPIDQLSTVQIGFLL